MLPESVRSCWPGLAVDGPLSSGARNDIRSGQLDGVRVVIRHSRRNPNSRSWEWHLLRHLQECGIHLPVFIPSSAGDLDVDGWHVYEYVEGSHPEPKDPRIADALAAVHAVTEGWPQRPGSASSIDLPELLVGGDIDLTAMPTELANQIVDAWRGARTPSPTCVVHGDAHARNAIIDKQGRCVLLDWDEARVDQPHYDLPVGPADLRANVAWEIATCWIPEPDYARSLVPDFTGSASP
ncbi:MULTISPECIES: phosphotransferase enzyme family protein [unclassified Rhodococcus (in: high G+C Gram-positive bacteria)]|uniref:phosphotransferase enzyme family protein n=1 Tax=unclassified Rhodococcus (in: high G+C Gram-positive bacteria) TaxID=192944 RepID=UPI0009ED4377|nr:MULTISPECIES: aminoglycoside phosphotransferase family protein [unclassified Rhodococcus (in: high G+C Gram-positive bacteria)]